MSGNPNLLRQRITDVAIRQQSLNAHRDSGVYAMHAMSRYERAAFERHLRRCPACVDEVNGFRRTISRLAIDVVSPPPAHLRRRLLSQTSPSRLAWKNPRRDQSNRA